MLESATTFQALEGPDSESEDEHLCDPASTFQVLDDVDSDEDQRVDASCSDKDGGLAMWLEEADEDMIRLSDPSSPCCRYTCSSRGRQCFMDLMWTMRDSWPQNPGWLKPPPGMSTQEKTQLEDVVDLMSAAVADGDAELEATNTLGAWPCSDGSPPSECRSAAPQEPHQGACGLFGSVCPDPIKECAAPAPPPASVCSMPSHTARKIRRQRKPTLLMATTTCSCDEERQEKPDDEVMDWDASESMPAPTVPHEMQAEIWEKIDDDVASVREVGVQTEKDYNTDEMKDPREEFHEDVFYECESEYAEDAEAHVLEGEAFDELNVADGSVADTLQIALDSGAGEHVASRSTAPKYPVAESAGSRAGQHFVAAGGARIPNEGQFKLRLRSGGPAKGEGKDIESTFQVAKVTRPLWSVGRICDEGFSINFTQTEAVVKDKLGKAVCKFHRKGGLYLADLQLKSPADRSQDFTRRGK